MKFLLYLLLGYSVWEIDAGDFRALLNFCNRSGIRLRRIREGECVSGCCLPTKRS